MAEQQALSIDELFAQEQPEQQEDQVVAQPQAVQPAPKQLPEIEMEAPQSIDDLFGSVDVGEEPNATFGEDIVDIGSGIAQGFVTIVDAAVTAFTGADSSASLALDDASKYLESLLSAEAKMDKAESARILAEAKDAGVLDSVVIGLRAFAADPSGMVSQAAGSVIPFIAANILTGGGAAGLTALGTLGGVTGAGITKESIYDAVNQELQARGATKEEAEKIAAQAQAYDGKNLDQILLGSGLGIFASLGPAERMGLTKLVTGNIMKRMTATAVAEAVPEAIQGGAEKVASNVALQREGFGDVDTFSGAVAQGTLEGVSAAPMGALAGIPKPADTGPEVDTTAEDDDTVNKLMAERRGEEPTDDVTDDIDRPEPVPTGESVPTPDGGVGVGEAATDTTGPVDTGVAQPVPVSTELRRGDGELDDSLAQSQAVEAELLAKQAELEDIESILDQATAEDDPDVGEIAALNKARSELRTEVESLQNTLTDLTVKMQEQAQPVAVADVEPMSIDELFEDQAAYEAQIEEEAKPAPQTFTAFDGSEVTAEELREKAIESMAGQANTSAYKVSDMAKAILQNIGQEAYDFFMAEAEKVGATNLAEYQKRQKEREEAKKNNKPEQGYGSSVVEAETAALVDEVSAAAADTPLADIDPEAAAADIVTKLNEPRKRTEMQVRQEAQELFSAEGSTRTGAIDARIEEIRTEEGETAARIFENRINQMVETRAQRGGKDISFAKPKETETKSTATEVEEEGIKTAFDAMVEKEANLANETAPADGRKRALKGAITKATKALKLELGKFYGRQLTDDEAAAAIISLRNGENLPSFETKSEDDVAATPEENPETGQLNPNVPKKKGGRPKVYEGDAAKKRAEQVKKDKERRTAQQRTAAAHKIALSNPSLAWVKQFLGQLYPDIAAKLADAETDVDFMNAAQTLSEAERDALTDAVERASEARIGHLADLYRIILDKTTGPKVAAKVDAAKVLTDPNISAEEKAEAQKRAQENPNFEYPAGNLLEASVVGEDTTETTDRGFAGATTGTDLINRIIETGTKFEKTWANRLKKLTRNVQVRIVRTPEDLPPRLRTYFFSGSPARAIYDHKAPEGNVIYLNDIDGKGLGLNNTVALHELTHAATQGIIETFKLEINRGTDMYLSDRQRGILASLTDVMVAAREMYFERERLGLTTVVEDNMYNAGAFDDLNEFVAYAFTQAEMQVFLSTVDGQITQGKAEQLSLFGKLAQLVRKLFNIPDNQATAFSDVITLVDGVVDSPFIDMSENALVKQAANPKSPKKKKLRMTQKKILWSNFTNLFQEGIGGTLKYSLRDWKSTLNFLKANRNRLDLNKVKILAQGLTSDQLADWAKTMGLNGVFKANEIIQKKLVPYRDRMLDSLQRSVREWESFNIKYPRLIKQFANFLSVSTLSGVDPTKYKDVNDAKQNHPDALLARQNLNDAIAAGEAAGTIRGLKGRVTDIENEIENAFDAWNELINATDTVTKKRPRRDPDSGKIVRYKNGEPQIETVTLPEAQYLYELVRDGYQDAFILRKALLRSQIENSGLEGDANDPTTPLGKAIEGLEETFAKADKIGVYFPLMRQGKYWIRIGKGKNKIFAMFEDGVSRDTYMYNMYDKMVAAGEASSLEDLVNTKFIEVGDDTQNFMSELTKASPGDQGAIILRKVDKVLDGAANLNKEEIDKLRNDLFQMYLMTLPDRDIRKRFSKRKGTAGFSGDGLRTFIITGIANANQLSRLAYAQEIKNTMEQSWENEVKSGELKGQAKREAVWKEAERRVKNELMPDYNDSIFQKFATFGNQAAFVYMLTSIKSALVQFTQLPIVGTPVLLAKHGAKAFVTMARYGNLFNKLGTSKKDPVTGEIITKWGAPTVGDSRYVTSKPYLRKAWEWAHDLNMFQQTYSADMGGMAKDPTAKSMRASNSVSRGVFNLMTAAFIHSERISREMMYMASFELEYDAAIKKGMKPEEAQEYAQEQAYKDTKEAMFNYSQFNKPPIMKDYAISRLAFQFMTYTQQIVMFLGKNFMNMLPLLNKEQKKEAATKFFGTLMMTGAFAGLTGMPLYSVITGTLTALREQFRDDDDDDIFYDMDDDGNPLGKRDLDLWFRTSFIPSLAGDMGDLVGLDATGKAELSRILEMGLISSVTDMNIGASTSLDALFHSNDTIGRDSRTALQEMVYTNLFGPGGSMALSFIDGFQDIQNGDIQRGAEKFLPAFVRGTVKSLRLAEDGETTRKGAEVRAKEFFTESPEKLLAQAAGFASTEVAQEQKANILMKRVEIAIKEERGKILADLDRTIERFNNNPSDEAFDAILEVFKEVHKFNVKNGFIENMEITNKTIDKSLEGRAKRRAEAINGLIVDKNTAPFFYMMKSKQKFQ